MYMSSGVVDITDFDWRDFAACRGVDPAIFYPDKKEDEAIPRRICADCSVQETCLEDALNKNLKGFLGGMSDKDRKNLKRRRARASRRVDEIPA